MSVCLELQLPVGTVKAWAHGFLERACLTLELAPVFYGLIWAHLGSRHFLCPLPGQLLSH